ncbi:hypothetical protein [Archangium sp.]|nr:hypothetical protein [Archangium sp.]
MVWSLAQRRGRDNRRFEEDGMWRLGRALARPEHPPEDWAWFVSERP